MMECFSDTRVPEDLSCQQVQPFLDAVPNPNVEFFNCELDGHENEDFESDDESDKPQCQHQLLLPLNVLSSNLYPATSGGITRVSSCYFSICSCLSSEDESSAQDLLQLLDYGVDAHDNSQLPDTIADAPTTDWNNNKHHFLNQEEHDDKNQKSVKAALSPLSPSTKNWNAVDVLYHDIMMYILTFLPASSLAAFSETAKRPNFECFYFLQLQLQRALLFPLSPQDSANDNNLNPLIDCKQSGNRNLSSGQHSQVDSLAIISGSSFISRLATMDLPLAETIVQSYLDSNSTLKAMPLSHSLAYLRHVLLRSGLCHHLLLQGTEGQDDKSRRRTVVANGARAAALLVTLIGAASYMSSVGASGATGSSAESMANYAMALRHGLLKLGLAGSLMKAGATAATAAAANKSSTSGSDTFSRNNSSNENSGENNISKSNSRNCMSMRETAEQIAKMLHDHFQFPHLSTSQAGFDRESGEGQHQHGSEFFPTAIAARLYTAFFSAYGESPSQSNSNRNAVDSSIVDSHFGASSLAPSGLEHRCKRSHLSRKGDGLDSVDTKLDFDEKNKETDFQGIQNHLFMTDQKLVNPNAFHGTSHNRLDDEIANYAMDHPITPDPYDHIADDVGDRTLKGTTAEESSATFLAKEKLPGAKTSGCVGAYTHAVHQATIEITKIVKATRKTNFMALSEDEQISLSTMFIDACASDSTLAVVKDILQRQNTMDVDGFYVGSDGTETCGLHTAAFNGATEVVKFLCSTIDELNSDKDGGLCDVNLRDGNGWTALHFAAGANCVDVVRILAANEADLTVEAENGYTPFHWAERLSNTEVAQELQRLGADNRFLEIRWIFGHSGSGGRRQPLSTFFAERFFSLIPSN